MSGSPDPGSRDSDPRDLRADTVLTPDPTDAGRFHATIPDGWRVMYVFGGPGIHGFTFVLLVGILVGTYSSIAIASPLLLLGKDVDRKDVGVSQYHFPQPQQLQKV